MPQNEVSARADITEVTLQLSSSPVTPAYKPRDFGAFVGTIRFTNYIPLLISVDRERTKLHLSLNIQGMTLFCRIIWNNVIISHWYQFLSLIIVEDMSKAITESYLT